MQPRVSLVISCLKYAEIKIETKYFYIHDVFIPPVEFEDKSLGCIVIAYDPSSVITWVSSIYIGL
jgi:hypothetical protein